MRLKTVALCVGLVALTLGAPQARAARGFGSQINGPFEDACGVATDAAEDLYVSEYYRHQVDVYGSGRELVTKIAQDPEDGPCALAVDSAGRIYVNDYHGAVLRFTPSSYPPSAGTTYGSAEAIDSDESTGVAIDPKTGDLYVDDRTYISKFDAPIVPGEEPSEKIGLGTLEDGYGLAFSSFSGTAGDLYVADAGTGTVKAYDPSTDPVNPVAEFDGAGTPQEGFDSLIDSAAAVDPTNGDLLVADDTQPGYEHPAAVIDEFNAAGEYRGQLPHAIVDSQPPGIAFTNLGELFITSGNWMGSVIYTFKGATTGRRLQVTKTGTGQGAVKSRPVGINCGTACASEYDVGTAVTLIATPDAHSTFVGWSGCGAPNGRECSLAMSTDKAVSAEFQALPQQPLAVESEGPGLVTSSVEGIECPGKCEAPFNEGSTVTLSASHDERSTFAGFTGCDAEPLKGQCEVAMDAARSVKAQFAAIPQRQLSIVRPGAGKGVVAGTSPGPEFESIGCGGMCEAEYDQGAEILLTATPNPGSKLAGWSGCDSQPAANQCRVTLAASRSVTTDFEPIPNFTLSVSSRGAGEGLITSSPAGISCPSTCRASFPEGETIVLSANPAQGSSFAGWSGACSGAGACRVVIGADSSASATFSQGAPQSPPTPAAPSISLGAVSATNGQMIALQVSVPAAGTLTATAPYIEAAKEKVKAGTSSLELRLSAQGKRALAGARRHRLAVKVTVSFTPAGSKSALTATKTIVFHRAPRKRGGASLTQKGQLFISFSGAVFPSSLPRNRLAPITVSLAGTVRAPQAGAEQAAVRQIEIAVNRHGVLDTRGLPTCPRRRIAFATTAEALSACRDALVGEGSFVAHIHLGEQVSFPSQGHILAFNARRAGRPVILAHVYGTQPVPITHILVFSVQHQSGTYGTVLSSSLSKEDASRAQIRYISLVLHRTYTYRGRTHSYLSASCPAPHGFEAAPFPLAHTVMGFTDGESLKATIIRSCGVSQ